MGVRRAPYEQHNYFNYFNSELIFCENLQLTRRGVGIVRVRKLARMVMTTCLLLKIPIFDLVSSIIIFQSDKIIKWLNKHVSHKILTKLDNWSDR